MFHNITAFTDHKRLLSKKTKKTTDHKLMNGSVYISILTKLKI